MQDCTYRCTIYPKLLLMLLPCSAFFCEAQHSSLKCFYHHAVTTEVILNPSLPRVINFNFLFQSLTGDISCSMENWAIDSNHFSLHHSIIFFLNGWENVHYELGIERVKPFHCHGSILLKPLKISKISQPVIYLKRLPTTNSRKACFHKTTIL